MVVSPAVCSACGGSVGTTDICLACLLRVGLDEAGASADSNGRTVFGDFEIERREDGSLWELGRGAMGVTYRASDKVLHRAVALKVIEGPAASDSQAVRERFLREARAAAALRHPNIAGVFQFGASPEIDRCYCAMELVEGETLEARVRREGPLNLDLALEVALQVTRALIAAAERGLVHRDLKPGNIMLTDVGDLTRLEVKVIDFGLAKAASDVTAEMELTHGGFVGTPAFASPEQFAGDTVDVRSDIYALGVTLWFALTGRLPFAGRTIEQIRDQQVDHALPLEQLKARAVPEAVIALLRSCLAIDPAKRPASAGELIQAVESFRERLAKRGWRRKVAPFVLGLGILTAAVSAYLVTRPKDITSDRAAVAARPIEKSIAVLPFQNLSEEAENAFLAGGLHDDLLSSLAKIKDLKVIAPGSVADYRDGATAGKLREIGTVLGVAHLLQGSVRRAENRVVVNVALIDARSQEQKWAQRYERTFNDILLLQGELAVEIARELHATLTPAEAMVAAVKPTQNPEAYLIYLRGRELELRFKPQQPENYEAAVKLYQQAVDLDPKFALARARLSLRVTFLAFHYQGKTSARMQKALAEAEEALRLQPHLGEARVALAHYYTWAKSDFDRALAELARAEELIPNSAEVWNTRGQIYKRQDKFRERIAALQRAETLDPRGTYNLGLLWVTFRAVRDWPEVARTGERMKALLRPEDNRCFWGSAYGEFRMSGAINPLKKVIAEAPIGTPPGELSLARYELAMLERDFPAAERFLRETPAQVFEEWVEPKLMQEALLAVARGADPAVIERALVLARQEIETLLADEPADPDGRLHTTLGLIDAFRGRKEDAIRAGRRGLELADYSMLEKNDAAAALALIYARTGEPDEAIRLIEELLTVPANLGHDIFSITLTDLKWRWQWDPLRSHPRFQKLLAGPEPMTIY